MRVSEGALLAAASALAYGCLGVLAKLAYGEGWNTPSLLTVRFLLAALCILPFALRAGGGWKGFGAGMLLGAAGYAATTALYFPSLQRLPTAIASFLLFVSPVLVAILSRIFLKERLGWRGRASLVLAVAGLLFLTSGAFRGELDPLGVLLGAGSAVAYAVSVIAGRSIVRELPWTRSSLAVCVGAFAAYLAFSVATDRLAIPVSAPAVGYALAIGLVATGLAMSLFFAALARIGASRTALISTLEPVSTLVFAWIVLAEDPGWAGVVGGLLIVASAGLVAAAQPEEPALHE